TRAIIRILREAFVTSFRGRRTTRAGRARRPATTDRAEESSMERRVMDTGPSRRTILRAMGALGVAGFMGPVSLPRRAGAQGNLANLGPEEPVDVTMKRLCAGRRIKDGSSAIKIDLPLIAENGAVVPISVDVNAPMTPQSYVKAIYIVSDKN